MMHDTNGSELVDYAGDNYDLDSARGCIVGLCLSAAFMIAVGSLAWWGWQ